MIGDGSYYIQNAVFSKIEMMFAALKKEIGKRQWHDADRLSLEFHHTKGESGRTYVWKLTESLDMSIPSENVPRLDTQGRLPPWEQDKLRETT